jgi:hypothetical protein
MSKGVQSWGTSYSSKIPTYLLAEQRPTQTSGVMALLLVLADSNVEKLELDPKHPSRTKSPMAGGSRVKESVGVGAGTAEMEAGVVPPAVVVAAGTVSEVRMFAELEVVETGMDTLRVEDWLVNVPEVITGKVETDEADDDEVGSTVAEDELGVAAS